MRKTVEKYFKECRDKHFFKAYTFTYNRIIKN